MPELSFKETGNGPVLLFIHGFPMNSKVWDEFIPRLSSSFKVIAIDLPGFGNSPILKTPFSIGDVADEIIKWLSEKKIRQCVVIGHSLGGYVTLALAEKKPENFAGIGLFHSTAYADSPEKNIYRKKVV
jgi:pimeloyl-ACP methyl ester carboxylesterase